MARRRPEGRYTPEPFDMGAKKRRNWVIIFACLLVIALVSIQGTWQKKRAEIGHALTRVQDAFEELGGALDRYKTDAGVYPIETPGLYSAADLWMLTTPHNYLWEWRILKDPFAEDSYRVAILDTIPPRWLLISLGPDREPDWAAPETGRRLEGQQVRSVISQFQYDPSNGLVSRGDILLLGK